MLGRLSLSLSLLIAVTLLSTAASAQMTSSCLVQMSRSCQVNASYAPPMSRHAVYQQCMAQAQRQCMMAPGAPGSWSTGPTRGHADPRIVSMVQRVMQTMCPSGRCGQVRVVSNPAEQQGASARSNGHGYTLLSYSPSSLNAIVQQYGPNAILGIMAHEIGHHFDFNGSPWAARMQSITNRELKADWFAGCALARMGVESASLSRSLQVMGRFPTHGYPGGYQRATAVHQGYLQCGGRSWPAVAPRYF